jgi:hypothetical protein
MLGVKVRVVPVIHRPARLRYHTGNIYLLNSDILIPDLLIIIIILESVVPLGT